MADQFGKEIPRRQVLSEYSTWVGQDPPHTPPVPPVPAWRMQAVYLVMIGLALFIVVALS